MPLEAITITTTPPPTLRGLKGRRRSNLTDRLYALQPGQTLHYRGPLARHSLCARAQYIRQQTGWKLYTTRHSEGLDFHRAE